MNAKQNPFSLYDFLGYFLPGALCFYLFLIACPVFGIPAAPLTDLYPTLFRHPDVYIPFVIGAYVLGHLLSYLSSITVERYSIWAFGYPSQFLLGHRCRSITSSIPAKDPLRKTRIGLRWLVVALCLPFTSLDLILERTVRIREVYARPLDKKLRLLIQRKLWLLLISHAGVFKHCKSENDQA